MDLELARQHRAHVEESRRRYRTGLVTLVFGDMVSSIAIRICT